MQAVDSLNTPFSPFFQTKLTFGVGILALSCCYVAVKYQSTYLLRGATATSGFALAFWSGWSLQADFQRYNEESKIRLLNQFTRICNVQSCQLSTFSNLLTSYNNLILDYTAYYNGLTDDQRQQLIDMNNQAAAHYIIAHDGCSQRWQQLVVDEAQLVQLPDDENVTLETIHQCIEERLNFCERLIIELPKVKEVINLLQQAAFTSSVN